MKREKTGKGAARKLREQGLIPAVVYAGGSSTHLTLNPHQLSDLLKELGSDNAIMPLAIEGESGAEKNVILKEMQTDPLSDEILHVDLFEVAMDKAITVEVPITLLGEPESVKDGDAIIERLMDTVEVECLPTLIPSEIEVEIGGLGINDVVHLSDLPTTEGVRILRDLESPVVIISAVKVVAEEEIAEEEVEEAEEAAEEAEAAEGESAEKD
jgi:large subunit ribosomal protein L25